jgi:hypothetical protein
MRPELEELIRAVESRAGRKEPLTRHDARPILLFIGQALLEGRPEELGDAAQRLRTLPEPVRSRWIDAVRDEMSMACTEHVRSVDPRFLDHPKYDLAYTLEARRLLEARSRACDYLGHPSDPAAKAAVARADSLLERRAGGSLREWIEKPGVGPTN